MATKQVTFQGKAQWFNPWELDTAFVEDDDPRGGNYAVNVILDDEGVAQFKAMGAKAKLKEVVKDDGDLRKAVFRRYERHPVIGELGPVIVTGVPRGVLVGNDSDITVVIDLYDFSYKGRPSRGIRLVSVNVDNIVEYVKPDTTSKPAVGVPAI